MLKIVITLMFSMKQHSQLKQHDENRVKRNKKS